MTHIPNCPCDVCTFPGTITNNPGLPAIRYRTGDFTGFRNALLEALPGETELVTWKPTSTSDLALQMIEWWAYLADILTFYNERIANQDYLRTADLDASVNRLIRILGYRPRPGIGAAATLAAIVSAKKPILLPQGFAVQSKPGPGKQPQIFELSAPITAQPGGAISADPDNSLAAIGTDGTILLQGTVSSLKPGDLVLLVEKGWSGKNSHYVTANVVKTQPLVNARGISNTQVVLGSSALPLPSGAIAANYRLMRSAQTARLFQYGVDISLSLTTSGPTGTAHLDSVARQIKPGDLILFDSQNGVTNGPQAGPAIPKAAAAPAVSSAVTSPWFGDIIEEKLSIPTLFPEETAATTPGPAGLSLVESLDFSSAEASLISEIDPVVALLHKPMQLAIVNSYTELMWYADNPSKPTVASSPTTGIPVFHSAVTFTPQVTEFDPSALVIHYNWQDAGVVIPPAATSFNASAELIAVKPPAFVSGIQPVLLEDTNGSGDSATGTVLSTNLAEMQIAGGIDPALTPPINVLTNLLPFTRGKSVPSEILGSGDATIAGQEFALAKSPLTYLLSADSSSGGNYSSTLKISVNGVQWIEQPSFYDQLADAQIFVTREDENNITHVQFGDGINGARLPTGTGNVSATYRFGSGQDAPDSGTLTVIATPQPGLASVRNPVAAGGGADPEPASQIRKYAPLSVLTFGRAISGDDYEAIAASTPGVRRASAVWSFDGTQQRTTVTVYVGDDASAQSAAQIALRGDADPNRPVTVLLAKPIALTIALTIAVDPRYDPDAIKAAATAALTDPDTGLFGANRIGIGEVIYLSRIYAACLSVPGTIAVHGLTVSGALGDTSYRLDPGEGSYFTLDPVHGLSLSTEVGNG
jgi:hypothetical protein